MVFDGFKWYPKDSYEGKVTQESMAERQLRYGPNGSNNGHIKHSAQTNVGETDRLS